MPYIRDVPTEDRSRARNDEGSRERRRAALPSAPPAAILEALADPELEVDDVLAALRNRQTPVEALRRVARTPRWTVSYDVKCALARHPNSPTPVAMQFLHHLYWRELVETAGDVRVHPTVRVKAEGLLRVRMDELALGERVALARRASRGLVAALRDRSEAMVLDALLHNPRLVEADVVQIARRETTPGEVLGRIAAHAVWGGRLAVRKALVGNPATPVHAALRIVDRLARRDLVGLRRDPSTPGVVRIRAERRLAARGGTLG